MQTFTYAVHWTECISTLSSLRINSYPVFQNLQWFSFCMLIKDWFCSWRRYVLCKFCRKPFVTNEIAIWRINIWVQGYNFLLTLYLSINLFMHLFLHFFTYFRRQFFLFGSWLMLLTMLTKVLGWFGVPEKAIADWLEDYCWCFSDCPPMAAIGRLLPEYIVCGGCSTGRK